MLEVMPKGTQSKAGFHGQYTVEHIRGGKLLDKFTVKNVIVNEGLDYLLDVGLSGGTPKSTWYIGIFEGNYTNITGNEVASTVVGLTDEVDKTVDIVETARQTWVEAGVSGQAITNAASPVVYTFAGTTSVYGLFLISDNTMPTVAGGAVLMSIARFPSVRNMVATDVLNITYQISAADDGV